MKKKELEKYILEIIEILNDEFGDFIPECGGNLDSTCERCKQYLYCIHRQKMSDKLEKIKKIGGEK